jgi:hypothetical protein
MDRGELDTPALKDKNTFKTASQLLCPLLILPLAGFTLAYQVL